MNDNQINRFYIPIKEKIYQHQKSQSLADILQYPVQEFWGTSQSNSTRFSNIGTNLLKNTDIIKLNFTPVQKQKEFYDDKRIKTDIYSERKNIDKLKLKYLKNDILDSFFNETSQTSIQLTNQIDSVSTIQQEKKYFLSDHHIKPIQIKKKIVTFNEIIEVIDNDGEKKIETLRENYFNNYKHFI